MLKLIPHALARGGQVAESMGQSVSASQFQARVKSKVVSSDVNLEQLMMKAKFEESKNQNLAMVTPSTSYPRRFYHDGPEGCHITATSSKEPIIRGSQWESWKV